MPATFPGPRSWDVGVSGVPWGWRKFTVVGVSSRERSCHIDFVALDPQSSEAICNSIIWIRYGRGLGYGHISDAL